MGARGVAFLGPSAPPSPRVDRRVEVRPPARRGDVIRAAREGFRVIGLVDGELYQALAVTPQEVREAARIARVIGAASLGALRACECPGVEGVGEIYQAFRDGRLAAEDEVVGTYDDRTHRNIAFPLVIVREALSALDPAVAAGALAAIAPLPFHERTEARLASLLPAEARPRFRAALVAEPNVKQRDAALLLDHLTLALDDESPA